MKENKCSFCHDRGSIWMGGAGVMICSQCPVCHGESAEKLDYKAFRAELEAKIRVYPRQK